MNMLLPTTLVGSYAMPEWLIDRARLAGRFPPRVRALELWRPAPDHLEEAQDDATIMAIHMQERAGIDIVTVAQRFYQSHEDAYDYLVIYNTLGVAAAGEGTIAFEEILRRFPAFERKPGDLTWNKSFTLRGLKTLPIRFDRGAQA